MMAILSWDEAIKPPAENTADWLRSDGTQKGQGFLGPLQFHDGRTSTEVSVGIPINGTETEVPALVPTLTQPEVDYILKGGSLKQNAGAVADSIVQKAAAHATKRIKA